METPERTTGAEAAGQGRWLPHAKNPHFPNIAPTKIAETGGIWF